MGIKKYFGDKPQKEPKPFSAQFGSSDNGDLDFGLIDESKPSYFPSPEKLMEYEELQEGSADRIIALVEAEQKHRHKWEKSALGGHQSTVRIGQFLAAFIAVAVIAAVIFLAMSVSAIAAAGLAIGGMIWVGLNTKLPVRAPKPQKFEKRPYNNDKRPYNKKFRHRRRNSR